MKKLLLAGAMLLMTTMQVMAQKSVYIPYEWRNRTDTLIYKESDPNNEYTWSKSRSKESDNAIVFWDKGWGSTSPSNASSPYHIDVDDLLKKCEEFYALEINKLGFVNPDAETNMKKYKMMVLLNHTTEWICVGSGYDYQINALWLSPSTCQPVGQAVAHEVGHSFHYMCYCVDSNYGTDSSIQTGFHGAVGNGSVTWEQTAQWQSLQSYPELMYDQSIGIFRNSHNYAFTHEWHRYQSYWFFYYINQYYNDIQTLANVWNYRETKVKDFNEVLMDYKGLSVNELYKMYFDYACHLATWDLDVCKDYRDSYIGDFNYRCALDTAGYYNVAFASCPQSTGFNVIPLQVPAAGTKVTTHFTALRTASTLVDCDPGEYLDGDTKYVTVSDRNYLQTAWPTSRGFRLGYVALLNDGTRKYFSQDSVYCTGAQEKTCDVSFDVPDNTKQMWLIVSPAPSRYYQHKWDESISADDMWPYKFTLENTDLTGKATIYASPILDGRDVEDVTFDYDVYFPATASGSNNYNGTTVNIGGRAAQALGTAFQMETSQIASKMQTYSTTGPGMAHCMFYPVDAQGNLVEKASTANGYGHWFNADGEVDSYSNGAVFSELATSSLTFTIGQYPGKLAAGQEITIRQAIKYRKTMRLYATAYFNFHVHITDGQTGSMINEITTDIDNIQTANGSSIYSSQDTYDLQGKKVTDTTHGIYIVGRKKIAKK